MIYVSETTTSENTNNLNVEKSLLSDVNITKENLEDFLSLMVGYQEWPYNNISEISSTNLSNSNHATFERIIRILFVTNKYTKDNDKYYFNLDDVNDIARKYFNRKDFNYDATEELNYTFNKENNKYESSLAHGLFETGPSSYEKPIVKEFTVENDNIKVELSIITNSQVDNTKSESDYVITLGYEDNSYVIKSIEKGN